MTPSPTHKHLFYAEMAKLLEAGFDIRKAAAVLEDTGLPAPQRAMLAELGRGLDAGESIAAAFGADRRVIGDLERQLIDAGERGGKLGTAFHHLSDYFERLAASRRALVRGMIYPAIVLHLGIFVGTVPAAMMSGDHTPGEMLADFLLALLILYIALAAAALLGRALLKKAPESAAVDGLVNRLPWIGKARRNLAMARFCQVYHACLLAAIPMRETVRVSAGAARSGRLRRAGKSLETAAADGRALGPAFLAERAFPREFSRAYASGEEAGTLDVDLERWTRRFGQAADDAMSTAAIMLPKLMYFAIVAYVAWQIIGFFAGYYGMLESIGEGY